MAASISFCSWRFFKYFKTTIPSKVPMRTFSNTLNSDLVRVTKQDQLHIIAINRPEKRNCVNPETAVKLRDAFQNFEEDSNALVAILRGIGGTFCAGYDLKEIAAGNTSGLSFTDGPMGPTRKTLKKPVIAAIDGYAVAGGFELALWCDMRVVEETAIMGVFCRRFGVPLIDGGTVRLPKLIGLGRALDLILTGRGIDAREANEMGLVTKLCKKGCALETAINLAKDLCKFPQDCMNVDRLSAYKSTFDYKSIDEAFKHELENAIPILVDAVKGAENFVKGAGRHGQNFSKESVKEDNFKSKL